MLLKQLKLDEARGKAIPAVPQVTPVLLCSLISDGISDQPQSQRTLVRRSIVIAIDGNLNLFDAERST